MFYDYHVHSNFSGDCNTNMEDTIIEAINKNIKEICFCDHVDYDFYDTKFNFEINYDDYFQTLNKLQCKYKDKLSIKHGIEFGLQPHLIDKYNDDANNYPFDFILCSVHSADKKDLSSAQIFKDTTQINGYNKYFSDLLKIVENFDNYSVLSHLDIIRRYGRFNAPLENILFSDIIEQILKIAISKGKGIEVNTSGFRYNLNSTSPSIDVLKLYKHLGGEIITCGSDSHTPSTLSYKFKETYDLLKYIGFKYICTFSKKTPKFIKID